MNTPEAAKEIERLEAERDELLNCLLYLRDYHIAITTDLIDDYINKALKAKVKTETREPYMSGYRAGWNDALREISFTLANATKAMAKK